MLRGMFRLGALLAGGLVALAVASLAVIYFIVKLISPDTADRALEKIRSKVRRVA
jgi:hypothetical protein